MKTTFYKCHQTEFVWIHHEEALMPNHWRLRLYKHRNSKIAVCIIKTCTITNTIYNTSVIAFNIIYHHHCMFCLCDRFRHVSREKPSHTGIVNRYWYELVCNTFVITIKQTVSTLDIWICLGFWHTISVISSQRRKGYNGFPMFICPRVILSFCV